MEYSPKLGAPVKPLLPKHIDKIVEGFGKTFALRRAAGWAEISPYHLRKWLLQGERDLLDGVKSNYAHLFIKVAKQLSEKASTYIERLEHCPNNAGSLTWLMEKCLRDDYGNDSIEYKELVDLYKKLLESYKRLQDGNPIKNEGIQDGIEVDTESN